MPSDQTFVEKLRDEAQRIDAVLTEAVHLRSERVKQLAIWRRALAYAIPLFETDEFPDEGI